MTPRTDAFTRRLRYTHVRRDFPRIYSRINTVPQKEPKNNKNTKMQKNKNIKEPNILLIKQESKATLKATFRNASNIKNRQPTFHNYLFSLWRRGGDSNSRSLAGQQISSLSPSASRTPLRCYLSDCFRALLRARSFLKKLLNWMLHSSCITPSRTSTL